MIVVSRPNNPDGHIVSRELVEELCKNDCIVVVDEAYVEFSGDPVEDILEKHPNMIITHTFSKAMGLAAIRLGFAVASPELIGYINQVRMPTNVNVLARAAAVGCRVENGFSMLTAQAREQLRLYAAHPQGGEGENAY